MLGRITVAEGKGRRPVLERETIRGLPLLHVSVPSPEGTRPRAAERRVGKAARALAGEGVRRVLAPPGFPFWPLLEGWGLRGVEASLLCQAMAAPLALEWLRLRGIDPARATVALRGNRVSRPFFQAAETLCARVRGLVVSAPSGGAALSAHLRGEYGVPVLEEGEGTCPVLTLQFSPLPGGGREVMVLHAPKPDLLGLTLRPAALVLPGDIEPLPLLAALWEEGRVSAGDLTAVPAGAR